MRLDHLYYRVDSDTVIIVSKPETTFAFRGRVTIQVLSGSLNILGFVINSKTPGTVPIISAATNSAYTVNVLHNESISRKKITRTLSQLNVDDSKIRRFLILAKRHSIIIFRRYEEFLSNCICHIQPLLYSPKECEKVISFCKKKDTNVNFLHFMSLDQPTVIKVPDSWNELILKFQKAYLKYESNLRILVCGAKNTGKSTLLTLLINCLLNECGSLYHLECDPGQPEFVPPGCLALSLINKPVLEPTFLHQQKPLNCYSAGSTNVTSLPEHYIYCIGELHKSYATYCKETPKPLLINTMGYVKGIGLHLLSDIISIVQPTFVIQLQRDKFKASERTSFTAENLAKVVGWITPHTQFPCYEYISLKVPFDEKFPLKKSKFLRTLCLYSYFAMLNKNPNSKFQVHAITPYKVAFSDVALFCSNSTVPNHEILYAMNASVVALCKSDQCPTEIDDKLPKFLDKIPKGECIGYGIIRGIDMRARAFYVITPVAMDDLKNINVFLKTDVNLPEDVMINQATSIPPPYVVCMEVKKSLVGNRKLQKRKFRNRSGVRK